MSRYEKIALLLEKKSKATNEEKHLYYDEYAKMYLHKDESIDEFDKLYKELKDAYSLRKNELDDLYKEIKTIKKLSV